MAFAKCFKTRPWIILLSSRLQERISSCSFHLRCPPRTCQTGSGHKLLSNFPDLRPVPLRGIFALNTRPKVPVPVSRSSFSESPSAAQTEAMTEPKTVTSTAESARTNDCTYSVEIKCAGEDADELVDALLCFGASACTIEDANVGTGDEEEIFSAGPVPWEVGERQLWRKVRLRATFLAGLDVEASITAASSSVGMASPPEHTVVEVADQDWVGEVQKGFVPIRISATLWVVPHWNEKRTAW
eukprot:TRINITY_DN3796_c0_g4_i1.p1 TRINITY_DN3796_c0_g4~~TRINITY_DN3796_c0_g4_i1.p1  ORF type:complete len:243 (+),score=12.54 TRINITY_DN3796_c0_g4_i1:98-826(+)